GKGASAFPPSQNSHSGRHRDQGGAKGSAGGAGPRRKLSPGCPTVSQWDSYTCGCENRVCQSCLRPNDRRQESRGIVWKQCPRFFPSPITGTNERRLPKGDG